MEMGYTHASGPQLFDKLASELADGAIEISSASAKRLYNAFQKGFRDDEMASKLEPLHLLQTLNTCNERAAANELIVSRVTLDESTGRCPRTGAQLRLINLDADQKRQLQDGLMYLAETSYEERHRQKNTIAVDAIKQFGEWLE
jgi:hypothetical protein